MTRLIASVAPILVIAIAGLSSAAASERVEHAAAGIAMDRPAGWQSASLEQIQVNRERARLSDPELQRGLVTRSAMPVIAFMKYQEPHAGLNPTVQVTLRPAVAGQPTQVLAGALEVMRRGFADFRIVSPVAPAAVDGLSGAQVAVTYTLQNQSGERFPVSSRLWLVPRGSLMFLIGMSGAQSGPDTCDEEFAAAFRSISIGR